ncbi:NAD-dependent epimerase [Thiocapsa imhoffii]|uniref:UDP-glucose 4-epimerase n=1 Tax=Thiocapsa imhoffii TaxID=382777 RepID=A0A9X0WHM5_9GAMM|nr:NAD-dependent epimerase/dehydratase family protein [Thiocapsa imhoffii]MBK1644896.1 NAD-dependent epimerase [Thiocapsa imhoffii]
MSGKHILILGGHGFIGSHLTVALVAGGARVRVLDRAGGVPTAPVRGVDYRVAEFGDLATLAEALADIDLVIHLISTTVPGTANLDPVADIEGNLIGTVRLLQKMKEVGVGQLLFLSSGGTVYGDTDAVPIPEQHPLEPLSSYGIVKVAIEHYIGMHARQHGMRSLILRVSNPYGPRQGHLGVQGVIGTFFQRLRAGDPIKIWGDGQSVRDYLYIDDLTDCICTAIHREVSGVFNVGSGRGTSLIELLAIVARVTGSAPEVEFQPARGFDVRKVVLDITKARTTLGWTPQVGLPEGCQRYWDWLRRANVT